MGVYVRSMCKYATQNWKCGNPARVSERSWFDKLLGLSPVCQRFGSFEVCSQGDRKFTPTPALKRIEPIKNDKGGGAVIGSRMKRKVYIAHPLRGDEENNVVTATEICEIISGEGVAIPFSPLHAFGFLDTKGDQTLAMEHCFALMESCSELWVFGKWWASEGCRAEIVHAAARGMVIKFKTIEAGKIVDIRGLELMGGRSA